MGWGRGGGVEVEVVEEGEIGLGIGMEEGDCIGVGEV